jgi:L-lactate dehydrogenase complex protein LldE
MKVVLFVPCFVDALFPGAAIAAVTVLERLGCVVAHPEEIACCGQPAFNSGCWAEARLVAEPTLDRLAGDEAVVVLSGSCGAMLKKFYGDLFAGTDRSERAAALAPRIWEFSQFLVERLGVDDVGASFPGRATFHDGCHGLRELGIKSAPRRLLAKVRRLELVEMKEAETCCGFGGAFAVKYPMISTSMGEVKCDSAAETGADFMVSNDSSCLMHLDGLLRSRRSTIKTFHLAEVLASK